MISFEEKYQSKRGIWVYRTVEMNYAQVANSVEPRYRAFMTQYTLAWYSFVKDYQKDTDPFKNYNAFDVYKLRDKSLYPLMQTSLSFSSQALERDYEGLRAVEQAMRRVDESMLDKLQAHYKRYEFAEPPQGFKSNTAPFAPKQTLYFRKNSALLAQRQEEGKLLIVAPLLLTWEYSKPHTRYTVHTANGMALYQTTWMKAANRFKDPIKRHSAMIEKVKVVAALTDWSMVERGEISNKQKRSIVKVIREVFKED